jgi:Right handed beta helix region
MRRSDPRTGIAASLLVFGVFVVVAGTLGLGAGPARADEPAPHDSAAAHRAAVAEAERQADLVTAEDQRLIEAQIVGLPNAKHPKGLTKPYRARSSGLYTLVLTRRRAPYTFDDLRRLAPETLVPQGDGMFLLRENVLVNPGATLSVNPRRPLVLRMSSGPAGFVSLVTQGGRLRLQGTASAPITIQSWNESRGKPDSDVSDGRAYVRASGQLLVEHVTFSRLGFWSGRTGGVSVVGSGSIYGTDVSAGTDPAAGSDPVAAEGTSNTEVLPAGKLPGAAQQPDGSYAAQISDATMTGNAFGLFVTGSSGPRITRVRIRGSLVDGLVLHRDVTSASVDDVRVDGSGADGVVIARRVEGTVLTRLDVTRSGRDGIVLAGKPMAAGPSASGASTRAFGNNVLTASRAAANVRIGIHVIGGTSVRVDGNSVEGGRAGIVVSEGASDVDVGSNQVVGASANGIQVRESTGVAVTANAVRNSPTGIHVRNSAAVLRQNSTSGVTLHGITFVGGVRGSVADENLLAGAGTSPIDVVRVADQQGPVLQNNNVSGWSRTVTKDSLVGVLLHPLTVIWMVVAVLLLGMSRPRRRGSGLPYAVDPLVAQAHAEAQAHAAAVALARSRSLARLEPQRSVVTIPDRDDRDRSPHQPVAAPARADAPRSRRSVIDLAIRESNLAPAAPRRRRVNSR